MTPNITTAGRVARAVSGVLCIIAAVVLWICEWPASPTTRWIAVVALGLTGPFQLYEARQAWCIARACGLRTPL